MTLENEYWRPKDSVPDIKLILVSPCHEDGFQAKRVSAATDAIGDGDGDGGRRSGPGGRQAQRMPVRCSWVLIVAAGGGPAVVPLLPASGAFAVSYKKWNYKIFREVLCRGSRGGRSDLEIFLSPSFSLSPRRLGEGGKRHPSDGTCVLTHTKI